MVLSSIDQNTWALCLWREARGEGFQGMRAVAWVISNRSALWDRSIRDVIMGKNQFTSMVEQKLPDGTWGFEFPPDGDVQWKEAQQIVVAIAHGVDASDPTSAALYYANLATATSGWFFDNIVKSVEHPRTVVIGHHTFFK